MNHAERLEKLLDARPDRQGVGEMGVGAWGDEGRGRGWGREGRQGDAGDRIRQSLSALSSRRH